MFKTYIVVRFTIWITMKTKIVLPFKDDLPARRFKGCLNEFLPKFKIYLDRNLGVGNYEFFIVEENSPETITFNLGRTINIGFDLEKENMNEEDIFMFHPIDILPVDTDYSVKKNTKFCMRGYTPHPYRPRPNQQIIENHYYYKSIAIAKKDFEKVNGFTNNFVGWGGEDDEFFLRLEINDIHVDGVVNEYHRLTHDGSNGPNYGKHQEMINKSIDQKKCISGLDDLSYKVISISEEMGIKKYLVE